jgi:CRP-like cAMP-binding protein
MSMSFVIRNLSLESPVNSATAWKTNLPPVPDEVFQRSKIKDQRLRIFFAFCIFQLPLFRDASNAFIRMISALLQQVQFVPGDYIIQQGDLVQEMYFLHRGEVVEVDHGMESKVIRKGSNINWQAVLIDWPASRTVRATDNCEVYVLARSDLDQVAS